MRQLVILIIGMASLLALACAPLEGDKALPLPPQTLRIVNQSLANGVVGATYAQTISADGGSSSLIWSISDEDALPPGLSFDGTEGTSASIDGVAAVAGEYVFSIGVTDGEQVALREFTVIIEEDNSKPQITSALDFTMFAGETLNKTLKVRGGTGPYTWSLAALPGQSLPSWPLSVNANTGVLSAAPPGDAQADTLNFVVSVSDSTPGESQAATSVATLTTIALGAPPLVALTATLPTFVEGNAATVYVSASGGTPPYSWSAELSGYASIPGTPALPDWIEIDQATGRLSVNPPLGSAPLDEELTVLVSDSSDPVQTLPLILPFDLVQPPSNAPRIVTSTGHDGFTQPTTFELPFAFVNKPYRYRMQARGGVAPYTWSASGLPSWLLMDATGLLSASPSVSPSNGQTIRFTATVEDTSGARHSGSCVIVIEGNWPLSIDPDTVPHGKGLASHTLPSAQIGKPYMFPLRAYGGTAPIHYEISGNPSWIGVDENGALTGNFVFAPANPYSLTVTATDSASPPQTDSATFALSVVAAQPLSLEEQVLTVARSEQTLKVRIPVTGGDGIFTFSIVEGVLPQGISLDFVTGILSGRTDDVVQNYDLTLRVSDSSGASATAALAIEVVEPVSGTIVTIANGYGYGGGDGGPASEADFGSIYGCRVVGDGLVLATNAPSYAVRRIDLNTRIVSTLSGNKNSQGGSPQFDIPAVNASLSGPWDIEADSQGNIYFQDGLIGFRVLKIEAATGILRKIADFSGLTGTQQLSLSPDQSAIYVSLPITPTGGSSVAKVDLATGGMTMEVESLAYVSIYGVAASSDGNLYFHDSAGALNLYKKDGLTGEVSTITFGYQTQAIREHPQTKDLYFANYSEVNCLKRDAHGNISTDSQVIRVAGGGASLADGVPATDADLYPSEIHDLDFDAEGNMYLVGWRGVVKKVIK